MKRRDFIRNTALTAAGVLGMPYILPTGRLFAASGARMVNHVVFCLFAGGIRNLESVQKAEGNLMRGLLTGNESITPDIANSIANLPAPVNAALQSSGTLFRQFRYLNGPSGHYNGHTTALTGRYTDNSLSLLERPPYPTLFELYRKHSTPDKSALNAWWISHTNELYPILNYSTYPGYGPLYGANQLSPTSFFNSSGYQAFGNPLQHSPANQLELDKMKTFLNGGFKGGGSASSSGISNLAGDQVKIMDFMDTMFQELAAGQHNNPWGLGPGVMNGDMRNVFYAEKVMQEFNPELMVVNMFGVDVCHNNFTNYCDNLRRADWAVNHLWNTIQNTPGMANDTVLIIAPEIGRNGTANSIKDQNGRGGLDHTTDDAMSRELFGMVLGPSGVVQQNKVVNTIYGESIDIVPTIAKVLGFDTELGVTLPGQFLQEAFV
ncbi:MAG: hypothetical protein ACYC1Q_06010 [Bacteroidia bacterium]